MFLFVSAKDVSRLPAYQPSGRERLRKMVLKRDSEEIEQHRGRFAGAERIFDLLCNEGGWSFSKAAAAEIARLFYLTAYFRCHFAALYQRAALLAVANE